MEFRYRDGQIQRTPSPLQRSLPANTYVANRPLQGCEFASCGFPSNVLAPRVFLMAMPINVNKVFQRELEKEKIWRELEKQEIRKEIIASEMTLTRQRELEEEVRKEMELERTFRIPMQRLYEDKSNNHHGGKHKAMTPIIDDNESLQKKAKKVWSCELYQITTTSEKGFNDHIRRKKHKANQESTRTQKAGLDSRPEGQTFHPCLTPTNTSKLESKKKDQVVHKSKGLGGMDNQNETITSKQAWETNELPKRKKLKFWFAFCQVGTRSEIAMQGHKIGEKHLANMKKFNHNSGGVANPK